MLSGLRWNYQTSDTRDCGSRYHPPSILCCGFRRRHRNGAIRNGGKTTIAGTVARKNGWPAPEALTVQGSAFYADHRSEKTTFGQFLALVADDLIPVGTVLLVDGISRFGRYDAMQALEDVNALIKGIELHSVTPGKRRIYDRDSLQDPDTINKLVNELAQARAELAEKQRLVLSAKREARERAINDGAPIPGMLPPWIKLVGHNKRLYKQAGGQLGNLCKSQLQ